MKAESSDVGSGANPDRPKLQTLRQLVARDAVGPVIAHDPARLSRSIADLQQLNEELAANKMEIQYVCG